MGGQPKTPIVTNIVYGYVTGSKCEKPVGVAQNTSPCWSECPVWKTGSMNRPPCRVEKLGHKSQLYSRASLQRGPRARMDVSMRPVFSKCRFSTNSWQFLKTWSSRREHLTLRTVPFSSCLKTTHKRAIFSPRALQFWVVPRCRSTCKLKIHMKIRVCTDYIMSL
jgi:hypothetical protein